MLELGSKTHLGLSYEDVVKRIENEGEVLRDLKERAGELGILSDTVEAYVINDLGRKHDVHIDFYSVSKSKLEGLERAKKEDHPEGTEYIFVSEGKRDEIIAEKAGWEYVEVEKVSEVEGWKMKNKNETD